ncbi:NrfD/PsrC family molybdoenzyme membrane anchor subunit [Micromonospora endophytica]|uniref:NrfD/PsrC family molybdoenzyme membrane anchor subunit n=1 Tax=Micromonospora endophytica TaxID=515350 RepID=UPI001C33990C|nr:NrfD/PsrC family molybdoenzyme membrane anchor subunit [Micromonospora endophytica]BCJ62666.1 polysulfide reductase [Micromonospora endophytica]
MSPRPPAEDEPHRPSTDDRPPAGHGPRAPGEDESRRPVGERFRRFRDGVSSGANESGVTPAAGRRRRRAGEELAVPPAEFTSYYGRPILKPPVWTWEIAAYLFTGGLAAGSSLLAVGGQLTGRPALRRAGRVTALAAVTASGVLLVKDLGRPERFHHMLRVAKPTSPMSVGTWILTAYGPAAGLAAIAEVAPLLPDRGPWRPVRRVLPPVGWAAGVAAAAVAPALGTYTAVLLSDTAVPSWHDAYPDLPLVFAGSALASGAGAALIAVPPRQAGPARRLAVAGAALELFGAHRVETRHGLLAEPYRTGRPGRLLRAGRALTAAGVVGALLGARSRVVSALSGAALLAASVATRFGVFHAGVASARDPRYTVLPQRERLQRRQAGEQDG